MDYIQKDLELIRMASTMNENKQDTGTPKHKKKLDKIEKKRAVKTSKDDPSSSKSEEKFVKKRAKTLSPEKLRKELKEAKRKEKIKSRKSIGGAMASPALGRIKLVPSIKKQMHLNKTLTPNPKTKKNDPLNPSSPILAKPRKKKLHLDVASKSPAPPKVSSPAVSSKSRKSIDPDRVPLEAIRFEEGTKIEAVDNGLWYKAKIVKVDKEKSDILVHFDGWGARFDTWFPIASSLIRGRTQLDAKETGPKYETGEDVLARWTDGNFYPATVLSVKESGSCTVMYFDGMKKLIRPIMIKKMSEKEKETAMKEVEKLMLLPQPVAGSPLSPPSTGSPSSADSAAFRKYRTSANDRERRIAARTGRQGSTDFDQPPVRKPTKRRASQIAACAEKQESRSEEMKATLIPDSQTNRNSSDDEAFIAKKARLDKITHTLLDRVSPTSESGKRADAKKGVPVPMAEHEDSDSDSPLVIDEPDKLSSGKDTLQEDLSKKKSASVTGARGPRAGTRRRKSRKSLSTRRSPITAAKKLEEKESQSEGKPNQSTDASLIIGKTVEKDLTARKVKSHDSTTEDAKNIEPRQEASEALLKLAQAYADNTDNSTDGSAATTPTKEVEPQHLFETGFVKGTVTANDGDEAKEKSQVSVEDNVRNKAEKEETVDVMEQSTPVYKRGDTVLAKWADCRSYLAYILKKEADDSYKIRYYDGMIKVVKSSFIHPWVGPLPDSLKIFKPSPPKLTQRRRSADARRFKKRPMVTRRVERGVAKKPTVPAPAKEPGNAVPVRRRSRTTSEDTPIDTIVYSPKEKILAKWTDLKWYPATVVRQTDNEHYQVRYHDDMTKIVRDTWLTPWKPPGHNDKQTITNQVLKAPGESAGKKSAVQDDIGTKADNVTAKIIAPHLEEKENNSMKPEEGTIIKTGEVVGLGEQSLMSFERFKVDDSVLARWTDCRSYPATVKKVLEDGKYVVEYYDGMQRTLKPNMLKYWNPSALPPQMKRKVPRQKVENGNQISEKPEVENLNAEPTSKGKAPRLLPTSKQPPVPRQVVRGYDAYYARLPPAAKDLVNEAQRLQFKCRVPGCTKSFRTEDRLRQHHKYYHQQRYKLRTDSSASAPKRRSSKEDSATVTRRRVSADYEAISRGLEQSPQEKSPAPEVPSLRSRGAKPPIDVYKKHHGNISISSPSSILDSSSGMDETKISQIKLMEPKVSIAQLTLPIPETKSSRRKRKRQRESDQVAVTNDATKEKQETLIDVEKTPSPSSPAVESSVTVNEDVIRCVCGIEEEEGEMIQCEGCFTWQHTACVGVDPPSKSKNPIESTQMKVDEVQEEEKEEKRKLSPAKTNREEEQEEHNSDVSYICWVCKNPQNVRESKKFEYSNEFLTKGKLPSLSNLNGSHNVSETVQPSEVQPSANIDSEKSFDVMMLAMHQLMDEVVKMQDALQGIKQKINVVASPEEYPLLKIWKVDDIAENAGEKSEESAKSVGTPAQEASGKTGTRDNEEEIVSEKSPKSAPKNGQENQAESKEAASPVEKSSTEVSGIRYQSSRSSNVSGTNDASPQSFDKAARKTKKKANGVEGRRGRSPTSEMSGTEREAYVHRCRDKLLDHIVDLERTLSNRLTRLEDYVSNLDTDDDVDMAEENSETSKVKEDLTAVQKLLLYC